MELKPHPDEIELQGKRVFDGTRSINDETMQRVEWLMNHYLVELVVNDEMWETLYQDPEDGRYWELTSPQNGFMTEPPKLTCLSAEQVRAKYNL